MATRKRRPKRRKKKTGIFSRVFLGIIAFVIISVFVYFFVTSSHKKGDLQTAIKSAYQKTFNKEARLSKTFDDRANLVYKISAPKNKVSVFIKSLKDKLPEKYKVEEVKADGQILLKVDNGKEVVKVLINLKQNQIRFKKHKKPSKKQVKKKFMYEEPLPKETHTAKRPQKKRIKIKGQPLLAIIIDDCGLGHMKSFEKALTIPYPITFAILPFRTYSKKCAYLANGKGYKVILHMPMEPISYPKANPGPGAIFKTDRKKEIIKKLNNAFANIAFAEGFNNHMGSAVTQSRFAVRVILSYASKHKKFFIDSRTTPKSVVIEEAKKLGFKVMSRDVFLDNQIDPSHITKQLKEAVKKAYEHGYAIAIGHNYPETVKVLAREMPKLDKKVNFIFVEDLYYGRY